MKKYLKTYVFWQIVFVITMILACFGCKALGYEPEYVGFCAIWTMISAGLITWSTYYEPKHNKG